MSEIKDKIEVVVVTKNGSKSPVNYIEYSELTGSDEVKQTVPDIVSKEHFSLIHSIQYIR